MLKARSVARSAVEAGAGGARGRRCRSSELHPGVDEAIGDVDEKVHEHHGEGVDHHHALQHGVVALVQGADDELAEAGPAEDDSVSTELPIRIER